MAACNRPAGGHVVRSTAVTPAVPSVGPSSTTKPGSGVSWAEAAFDGSYGWRCVVHPDDGADVGSQRSDLRDAAVHFEELIDDDAFREVGFDVRARCLRQGPSHPWLGHS